jgi:hypothetical protein
LCVQRGVLCMEGFNACEHCLCISPLCDPVLWAVLHAVSHKSEQPQTNKWAVLHAASHKLIT